MQTPLLIFTDKNWIGCFFFLAEQPIVEDPTDHSDVEILIENVYNSALNELRRARPHLPINIVIEIGNNQGFCDVELICFTKDSRQLQ